MPLASVPLLLFHPQLLNLHRIMRESIYSSQVILIIGLLIISARSRYQHTGLAAAGLIFGWAWVTREDGVWMIPGLIALFIVLASSWRSLPTMVIAFSIGVAFLPSTVGYLNQKIYGRWTVVEMSDPDFVAATSALASVLNGEQKRGVGVTHATRQAIYGVSPSFTSLRPILEAPDYWNFGCAQRAETCGEIANGWWHWALRAASMKAGYHSSPHKAAAFYRAITDEVNAGCQDGRLNCSWRPIKQLPTTQARDVLEMPAYFLRLIQRTFLFGASIQTGGSSVGSAPQMEAMLALLNRPYAFQSPGYKPVFLVDPKVGPDLAVRAMPWIFNVYRTVFYVLTLTMAALFVLAILRRSLVMDRQIFGLAAALALLISARLAMLSIIGVTSFNTDNLLYTGPALQLTVLFVLVLVCGLVAPRQQGKLSVTPGLSAPTNWMPVSGAALWRDLGLGIAVVVIVALGTSSIISPRRLAEPMVVGMTIGAAEKAFRLDPAIKGYADTIIRHGETIRLQGWAADTTNPDQTLSIAVFGSGSAFGHGRTDGERPDVKEALQLRTGAPMGFSISVLRGCKPGEEIQVMAISSDRRYAPLLSSRRDTGIRCP